MKTADSLMTYQSLGVLLKQMFPPEISGTSALQFASHWMLSANNGGCSDGYTNPPTPSPCICGKMTKGDIFETSEESWHFSIEMLIALTYHSE